MTDDGRFLEYISNHSELHYSNFKTTYKLEFKQDGLPTNWGQNLDNGIANKMKKIWTFVI